MSVDELRFLVVEDQGFQRWAMSNMLAGLGAKHVCAVADGRSALDAFHNARPPVDIIVTDLDMSGMDGMELIRHLGAARSRASMILVSGHDRSVIAAAQAAGRAHGVHIMATVEKPATTQELKAAIERHPKCAPPGDRDADPGAKPTAADAVLGLRRNAIEAFFQPRVHVPSGEIRGGQAIGVWRHPAHGPLLPGRFMSVTKAAGLQGQVDRNILASAVVQCREWRRSGVDQPVSVVLSSHCLSDLRFADYVHDVVSAHSLDVHHVALEIDELPAAAHLAAAVENIARLRMKGFSIALPYGPRHCVPEHFRALPCTELRVDQRYVRDARTSGGERASLVASLEAARAAGMTLSVHAVDTASDWDLLAPLAPHFAQGAWIGPPCPAREFVQKAGSGTCRVVDA